MPLKVLLVDDSPAVRLVLRSALCRVGIEPRDIYESDEAAEARRVFRRVHPELVFMDLSLRPRLRIAAIEGAPPSGTPLPLQATMEEGEGLAKRMLYVEPSLRLVVCTGHPSDSASVREVVKYGAYCVLYKPITLESIHRLFQLLAADGITISSNGIWGGTRPGPESGGSREVFDLTEGGPERGGEHGT